MLTIDGIALRYAKKKEGSFVVKTATTPGG